MRNLLLEWNIDFQSVCPAGLQPAGIQDSLASQTGETEFQSVPTEEHLACRSSPGWQPVGRVRQDA
jgi:hypothetical protein